MVSITKEFRFPFSFNPNLDEYYHNKFIRQSFGNDPDDIEKNDECVSKINLAEFSYEKEIFQNLKLNFTIKNDFYGKVERDDNLKKYYTNIIYIKEYYDEIAIYFASEFAKRIANLESVPYKIQVLPVSIREENDIKYQTFEFTAIPQRFPKTIDIEEYDEEIDEKLDFFEKELVDPSRNKPVFHTICLMHEGRKITIDVKIE